MGCREGMEGHKGRGCWPHAGGGSQHAGGLSPLLWCARSSSAFCCLRPPECARSAICEVMPVEILRFKSVPNCSQSLTLASATRPDDSRRLNKPFHRVANLFTGPYQERGRAPWEKNPDTKFTVACRGYGRLLTRGVLDICTLRVRRLSAPPRISDSRPPRRPRRRVGDHRSAA